MHNKKTLKARNGKIKKCCKQADKKYEYEFYTLKIDLYAI